jgi:acetylornithine deacetylase/succinyl-diaminopimelate desuccinylase-like protein
MEPSGAVVEAGCQGTMRVDVVVRGERAHSARAWMGVNAIHAAAPVLDRLVSYQARQPVIDGLTYREGLNAVGVEGGVAGNVLPDECRIAVNYRFAPDRSVDEALAICPRCSRASRSCCATPLPAHCPAWTDRPRRPSWLPSAASRNRSSAGRTWPSSAR